MSALRIRKLSFEEKQQTYLTFLKVFVHFRASLVTQMVKNPPAMLEMRARSLGQEDPLKKEMATHSSIRAWRIPRTEDPEGLQPMGLQRVGHD